MAQLDVTEGIPVGAVFESGSRTLGEGEFALLHSLSWVLGRAHTDREYMVKTEFGERVMAGPLVLAIMAGLGDASHILEGDLLVRFGIEIITLLSYENVRFVSPMLPGDTLKATYEIVEVRATSKPGRGIVKIKEVCSKDERSVVAEATAVFLFQKKS